jgi:GTP-binding protein
MKIALVGRRNVGKSTLVNALCGAERVMVSDVPGTTRDSVDVLVERDGRRFVVIDTAGLRKPGQMDDALEFFGHMRAERAVRRCDVAILMLDAMEEIGRVDKRLGAFIVDEHKPCVIALSKWDLARERNPDATVEDYQDYLDANLPGLSFARIAGVSGLDGTNVRGLVECAESLARQASKTTKTAALNACLVDAQKQRAPKARGGKRGRIYYGTQVGVSPPTFLLFCNNPAQFDDQYRRYLSGRMREELGFPEVPLRLVFRASEEKKIGRYR